MSIDAFILYQQLDDIEEDEIEDEQLLAGSATAIILLGAIEAQRLRTERRNPNRLYLCRPQLLRDPRGANKDTRSHPATFMKTKSRVQ